MAVNCVTPLGASNDCLMQIMCAKTNSGSELRYGTFNSAGFPTCIYESGSSTSYGYFAPVAIPVGGGMTADQLDLLMFGFLMVIFVLGIFMGHSLTKLRHRYGGDT